MSWKTINQILGLATADQEFWKALQTNPLATIHSQGFELTAEEQEVFKNMEAETISEFCRYLLDKLSST
ncbi:Os1348 family NHLP clan protein [Ktedonobacter racemifer]|uniref:Uncharacterized protein n=1 Tax=Ktedonobacter racemifer DSM 44963 TaxID=485913 RepID=D6TGX1_KTERA|nr:conserved hypothetical protein [Ktedonobacter racemifer DSM 44963]